MRSSEFLPAIYRPSSDACLLEESRESWEYVSGNEIVNLLKPNVVTRNSYCQIAKHRPVEAPLPDLHLTFRGFRNGHYPGTIEFDQPLQAVGQMREVNLSFLAMHGHSSVLINIAKSVETPQGMTLSRCTVIRLK